VSGTVVDGGQRPVRAAVRVDQEPFTPEGPLAETATDQNGQFHVAGDVRCWGSRRWAPLRLTAEADGLRSDVPVDCPPGSEGVVIVVAPVGSFSLRLVPPEGLDAADFECEPSSSARGDRPLRAHPDRAGVASWTGVVPGTYACVVRTRLQRAVVAQIQGILVEPGPEPEQREIDLAGLAKPVRVSVVDETGAPLRRAFIDVRIADGFSRGSPGRVLAMASGEPLELAVSAEGHRSVVLSDVRSDQEVRLRPGIRVILRALGSRALEEGERHVGVSLHRTDGGDGHFVGEGPVSGRFDGDRQATLILPGPGTGASRARAGHATGTARPPSRSPNRRAT